MYFNMDKHGYWRRWTGPLCDVRLWSDPFSSVVLQVLSLWQGERPIRRRSLRVPSRKESQRKFWCLGDQELKPRDMLSPTYCFVFFLGCRKFQDNNLIRPPSLPSTYFLIHYSLAVSLGKQKRMTRNLSLLSYVTSWHRQGQIHLYAIIIIIIIIIISSSSSSSSSSIML